MLQSNHPELTSWIKTPENSDFPIQNLPYGIASSGNLVFIATRVGDTLVDLSVLADFGYFDSLEIPDLSIFYEKSLNELAALPKNTRIAIRERLSEIFSASNMELQGNEEMLQLALYQADQIEMLMPIQVGDYTDFYSSILCYINVQYYMICYCSVVFLLYVDYSIIKTFFDIKISDNVFSIK